MLPSSVRILLCTTPQDMRRSFDTLALVVKEVLGEDPQSGGLYIFIGKRPTQRLAANVFRNVTLAPLESHRDKK